MAVPIGPPMMPPATMPTIADATASVAAPATPAAANSGAKARPVAGPPVSVTDPASTPISGCWPRSWAVPAPTTFWTSAITTASRKKRSTCGPPTRSSDRLAAKPIVVKNAIISGGWRAVSKVIGAQSGRLVAVISSDTSSPPITGAGRL